MPLAISIVELVDRFPDFRVAVVVADGITVRSQRSSALDALVAQREAQTRARWAGQELVDIPGIAAWRKAYRAFGVKQTRYRSAVERLVKNVLAGRALARVSDFVDLYNAVSLSHVLPLGADDFAKIAPPLAFRFARHGDTFVDMVDAAGEGETGPEAPNPGEVVYADAEKVLCRRWNWRQDAPSLIGPGTTHAVVTLQSNGWGDVEAAAADLADLVGRFTGGHCHTGVLDRNQPSAEV